MKTALALAALTLTLAGCGSREEAQPTTSAPPSTTPQVITRIHQETTTFTNERVLREYMRAVCKESPTFAQAPETPAGVSEKDAGYVEGLLISTGVC